MAALPISSTADSGYAYYFYDKSDELSGIIKGCGDKNLYDCLPMILRIAALVFDTYHFRLISSGFWRESIRGCWQLANFNRI